MRVVRGFIDANIVACFEEASGGGDVFDLDAPRNAPAKNPIEHLEKVYWHSDFFQYEMLPPVVVAINHTALDGFDRWYGCTTGLTGAGYATSAAVPLAAGVPVRITGQSREMDITLYEHDLGYAPKYIIAAGNGSLGNGTVVQGSLNGPRRSVSAYSTSTKIGLFESALSTTTTLPATTITYGLFLFKEPDIDPDKPLFGKVGDHLVLGRGKVDTRNDYLRRVLIGESSFDLNIGHTVEYTMGGSKQVIGDNSLVVGGYAGDFSGSTFVQVNSP